MTRRETKQRAVGVRDARNDRGEGEFHEARA